MRRVGTIGITALLLASLVPGVGEMLENVVHLAEEGHLAHAAAEGDAHDSPGTEHGCSGTMHLCSCCVSPSFAPSPHLAVLPLPESLEAVSAAASHPLAGTSRGVYHPPRA